MTKPWIEVDRQGLALQLADKPKVFILHELAQNIWDENSPWAKLAIERIEGSPYVRITAEDASPSGFSDLADAYTMFKASKKAGDAEKRGRFNLGEKWIIVLSRRARIISTTGGIVFDEDGRHETRERRDAGTLAEFEVRMTDEEMRQAIADFKLIIPPPGCETSINGVVIERREAVGSFVETLPTVLANAEGELRRTRRKATCHIYSPRPGEKAMIFEMGIPIVETGDRFHVDIGQKVPLSHDRDNVSPEFLRRVRVAILNQCAELLEKDDTQESWVVEAMGDDQTSDDVVAKVIAKRFGERVAVYDPNDPEAAKQAAAAGFTVLHGRSLPREAFSRAKAAGVLKTPRAFGFQSAASVPARLEGGEGETPRAVPRSSWNDRMCRFSLMLEWFADRVLEAPAPSLEFCDEPEFETEAILSESSLIVNIARTSIDTRESCLALLIRHTAGLLIRDRLSEEFWRELARLGAKAAVACTESSIPSFIEKEVSR